MSDLEVPSAGEVISGLSQWQRVTKTFSAPSKTFADIKRGNRSWWLPFILLTAATYILFAAITFKIGWAQVVDNTIRLNPKVEAQMAQLTPEQRATANRITLYSIEGTFIATPAIVLAGFAIFSLGL
jgi:cell division protein FtsB